jgi:hypothetical protein
LCFMLKRNEDGQYSIINQYINNKYWFICSALFFLAAASVYLIFTPNYKVTTRIVLNSNQNPEGVIQNIKSKVLLEKVIDQLPLRVSYYYKERAKEAEIPPDSLPIKFIFFKKPAADSSAEMKVTVVDNRQYKILEDKTYMPFFFNQKVDFYSFAKFKVVKGPAFNTHIKPVILRINNADELLEEYYKNLDAKFVGDDQKIIELSLVTNSLKKGKSFLDKLVEVYNTPYVVSKVPRNISKLPRITGNKNNSKPIREITDELTILKAKAEVYNNQQATFPGLNDSISKINRLIKAKQLEYNNLLQNKVGKTKTVATEPTASVIEKSGEYVITHPKTWYVYLLALLAGLALPLAIPYFKLRVNYNDLSGKAAFHEK